MIYKQKFKGFAIKDINLIKSKKFTNSDFISNKTQNKNDFSAKDTLENYTENKKELYQGNNQQNQHSEGFGTRKKIMGFFKDIKNKIIKEKEPEDDYFEPIQNKSDALLRIENIFNKYKGRMHSAEIKEFSDSINYLKNSI